MEKFKLWCLQQGKMPTTAKKHVNAVSLMCKKVGGYTAVHMEKYIPLLLESGRSPAYINGIQDSLRVYHHFLKDGQDSSFDPEVFNLRYLKERSGIKATMSDTEIEAFLALQKPRNASAEHWDRWTLFFEILSLTGLRTGELAKMKVENVNFGISCFEVLDDKTHRNRYVPIPPNISAKINRYVHDLKGDYLFPSLRGGGDYVDNVDWHYNFHSRLKRLGIKRPGLSPYSLRHSFITKMLDEGVSIFHVQKIVGHSQLSTTEKYTHLTTKDIQNAIIKLPRIKKGIAPEEILKALRESVDRFELADNPNFEYTLNEEVRSLKLEVKIKTIKGRGQ